MAKRQSADVNSFAGIFAPSEPVVPQAQVPLPVAEMKQEKKPKAPVESKEPRKRGRPKANRETKERKTFTLRPSVFIKASEIAYQEGKSISEVVEELLTEYINTHNNMN